MSQSFISTSSPVMQQALKVQEVCVRLADTDVMTATSGSTVTIDVGQPISAIYLASFFDDSAATNLPVVASNQSFTANTSTAVVLTLSAAFAAADSITMKYVIDPTQS